MTKAPLSLSSARIKAEAYALGFDLAGIVALGPADTADAFASWLDSGYAGTMGYLERGADVRRDSRLPAKGARSGIVVALNYGGTQPSGPVARYARGRDYHDVLRRKLHALHGWCEMQHGSAVAGKAYVDTGPVLERDLARRAGLGWFGKNTNLINPRIGSFFFLGALFVDLDLEPDAPFEADRCGTCRRCIDACPTEAIVTSRTIDARLCISYLTIELRDAIPRELRPRLGTLVFGCDICQDVCPWNVRFSRDVAEPDLAAPEDPGGFDPAELVALDERRFRERFRGTAIMRTKRRGLVRNAAVALGNRGDPADVPALVAALSDDEPLVRIHAAWALGRIATPAAHEALRARKTVESASTVLEELRLALGD